MCNIDFETGSECFVALFFLVFKLCQETDREGPIPPPHPLQQGAG